MPRPWWFLKGPEFDVVPGEHAIARRSWFYLRKIPLFYTPWFYKSLEKEPRKSGFLIPDVGNNSLHGKMVGFGYYWAISRSFDLTYLGQYYSLAGLANHAELRGKINEKTGFDLTVFGIKDTQQTTPDASGFRVNLSAKSDLGDGWEARGVLDYLSSFHFLNQFTQSFNEAIFSETHSVGFVTKHWGDFGVDFLAQRDVNFQSVTTRRHGGNPQASFRRVHRARAPVGCGRLSVLGVLRFEREPCWIAASRSFRRASLCRAWISLRMSPRRSAGTISS